MSRQYYMYSYAVTGSGTNVGDSFVAGAQGDLNGDGVLSLFQITGADRQRLRPSTRPPNHPRPCDPEE